MSLLLRFALVCLVVCYCCHCQWNEGSWQMNRYKELKRRTEIVRDLLITNGTDVNLVGVCGSLSQRFEKDPKGLCAPEGKPLYSRNDQRCDAYCCRQGYMTGYCKQTGLRFGDGGSGLSLFNLGITAERDCVCTSEQADIICGQRQVITGITCPWDKGACEWKCCQEGFNWGSGRCTGFLKFKCHCKQ